MQSISILNPKCQGKFTQTFIEVNGFVSPCCWLVTDKHRIKLLKEFFGDDFEKLFIHKSSINEIKQLYEKLKITWSSNTPFKTCLENCKNA